MSFLQQASHFYSSISRHIANKLHIFVVQAVKKSMQLPVATFFNFGRVFINCSFFNVFELPTFAQIFNTFPHQNIVKNTTYFLLTLAFWRSIIEVAFEQNS